MQTPTIYDIKYATAAKQPYFFSPKTMKFFGQTLRSFHVRQSPGGRIFIYAPMFSREGYGHRSLMGYTFREFVDRNLENVHNDDGSLYDHSTENDVLSYINTH